MDEIMNVTDKTPIEIALKIDDEGFTTARKLYEWLELDESHYSRWVKVNILENDFAKEGDDYSPLMASKGKGNRSDDYKVSAPFAEKLSMMSKSLKGEEARNYFIGCEQALKRVAEQKRQTELERAKGIAIRQALTKAIQMSGENERTHGHAYSIYTDVVYRSIFGKTAQQLRDEYGISRRDSLRDLFAEEDLKRIETAEMLISSLMGYGWGYDEIKDFVLNGARKHIKTGEDG